MENLNLNDVVKDIANDDYPLACQALRLRDQAERLRVQAMVVPTREQAIPYETQADRLMAERRAVVAQISPAGVNYNI